MKKTIILVMTCCLKAWDVHAQGYVFDRQRFNAVVANGAVRNSAETAHNQYLVNIKNKIDDINTNAASVVLAQQMIYNGLSQVNSALKDGIAVKNMAAITADILHYLDQALILARSDPALLLVTRNIQSECRSRAVALVTDVSRFVLKSGSNMLADYNARDELLKKVITQLQIIDGLAYGAWRAMYWAKEKGIIATLNPFQNFINQDRQFINQIMLNARYLK
ncbi:hypothetical protein [Mucilaginibacter phyllosphaerae]